MSVTNPYGKVFSTFWSSETTGSLSDDGKLLALYLMTCAHRTIAGVFRLPDGYACEDLHWASQRVREGFAELEAKGFAYRCGTTLWVWVAKHFEWNPPENPNQRKAAVKVVLAVPAACCWRARFHREVGPLVGLETQPDEDPSRTLPQGLPNQQQQAATAAAPAGSSSTGAPAPTVSPAPPAQPPAADAASTRGSRLPVDWVLPKAWGDWALDKYPHWTAETVRAIAAKFKNHWTDKTGKAATKVTWKGTWENWCDSEITQREHPAPRSGAVSAKAQADASAAKANRLMVAMQATGGAFMPAADLLEGTHG